MLKKAVKNFFLFFGIQLTRVTRSAHQNDDGFSFRGVSAFDWLKKYDIGTIIDIGANEGQFALKILSALPDAKIHCFEPLQDVFEKLKLNFKDRKNVTAYNFALGASNEEKSIYNNEYSPSSSMLEMLDLHKSNFNFAVKVEEKVISVRRLNDFFLESPLAPLLLKIDVQGYEMQVLEGGEAVARQADIIIIETTFKPLYKGQPLFEDIYNWMVERGFLYAGNFEQLLAPLDNEILQADAVFVNKGKVRNV